MSAASASEERAACGAAETAPPPADDLVQYCVVRRDLIKSMEWPVGSVIAQACHACLAVAWEHREDADTVAYLSAADSMHKVIKECKGEAQLRTLADRLAAEGVAHKLWVEQPENIPTAIALKPYPRSAVAAALKKFNL
jgi:peptidyl-tRNA hydrolase